MEKEVFYCNKPCKIVKDYGDEVLIDIEAGYVHNECGGAGRVLIQLMVNKKNLSSEKRDFQKEFKEYEIKKGIMEEKLEKIQAETDKLKEEYDLKHKELSRKQRNRCKEFELMDIMYQVITGKIKWVYYDDKLEKFDEALDETGELRAISYRGGSKKDTYSIFINRYYDGSGFAKRAKLFKTLGEAKKFLEDRLNNLDLEELGGWRRDAFIKLDTELNLNLKGVVKLREIREKEKEKVKRDKMAELERELAELKSN